MGLSDLNLRRAKRSDKPYRLTDADGLYVIVRPNGAKWWRFDYRADGTRKTISLGVYPDVPLADARRQRDDARTLVAKGVDPAVKRKDVEIERKRAVNNTFGKMADDYLQKLRKMGRAPKTMAIYEWLLEDKAASLRSRPIGDITPHEILALLQRIEAKDKHTTAHGLRGIISSVFRYAISNLIVENDPTYPLRGSLIPKVSKPQSAITHEAEFGRLLRTIDGYEGWATVRAALRIMALCYPRPSELRLAEWSHFDLKKRIWTIPEHLAKMRRPHDIPLSRQAVEIIEDLKPVSGSSHLVFPSLRTTRKEFSETHMNTVIRGLGYTKDEHCPHGFRASASSILNARKFAPDVIERSLAHIEPNKIRRAYNRYEYWDERVEMSQAWADICDDLKQGGRRNDDLI